MDTENGGDFTKCEADNFRNFRETLLETVNTKVRGGKTFKCFYLKKDNVSDLTCLQRYCAQYM